MADDDDDDAGGDGDETDFESSPGPGRKKLFLIIGAVALVLLIGGGAIAYKVMHKAAPASEEATEEGKAKAKKLADEEAKAAAAALPAIVFYDLPDVLVNIDSNSRKKTFLKLKLSVEMGSEEDIAKIESVLPKIVDNFQIYLRDLKPSQLEGAAGAFRIREELLVRVNAAVRPVQVKDVLVKEMLLQ